MKIITSNIILFLFFSLQLVLEAQSLGPQNTAFHSAEVHVDGIVYTWVWNYFGQLGDNTTIGRSTPIKVLKGEYSGATYLGDNPDNNIIKVALGWYHSGALAEDGTIYT